VRSRLCVDCVTCASNTYIGLLLRVLSQAVCMCVFVCVCVCVHVCMCVTYTYMHTCACTAYIKTCVLFVWTCVVRECVCVCVNQPPSLSTHLPLQNVQESELNQLAWTCVLCVCVCVCVCVFSSPPLQSSPSTKCSGIRIQSAPVSNIIILPARAHAPFRVWRQFYCDS
jgi:hypothetical protein